MSSKTFTALIAGVAIGLSASAWLPRASADDKQTYALNAPEQIIFVVNGSERARLDEQGLHINGDLSFSGASIDTVTYEPTVRKEGQQ